MRLPIPLLYSALLTALLLIVSISPSFAQEETNSVPTGTPSSSLTTPQTNPDVPQNLHTYTQSVVIELLSAFTCQLAGVDPINPSAQCLGIDATTGKIGFVENGGGLLGGMGTLISATYNIPFSSTDYLAYLGENFGLTKKAYAQAQTGGFASLSTIRNLWVSFRNIVYLLFIIIFVFVGLGIMLRLQIDPRTVMTIQNQIPKVIVGLILVTFSYAIAGLLVDLMWVSTLLSTRVIASADPANINVTEVNKRLLSSPLGFGNYILTDRTAWFENGIIGISGSAAGEVNALLNSLFLAKEDPVNYGITQIRREGIVSTITCIGIRIPLLGGSPIATLPCRLGKWLSGELSLGQVVGGTLYQLISWTIPVLAFVVIFIAILWALFRLWFTLLKAYIFILIDVVIAPFWIMLGVFPGNLAGGFGGWMRDMVANLSAFPVTIIMFLLGRVFMDAFGAAPPGTQRFIPPLIGNPGGAQTFSALIGVGIILMTPQVVNMTRDYLKAPTFKYTAAIGQAVGVGAAYPIATGRGVGATWLGTREYVPKAGGGWRERKWWEVFGGRAVGR